MFKQFKLKYKPSSKQEKMLDVFGVGASRKNNGRVDYIEIVNSGAFKACVPDAVKGVLARMLLPFPHMNAMDILRDVELVQLNLQEALRFRNQVPRQSMLPGYWSHIHFPNFHNIIR